MRCGQRLSTPGYQSALVSVSPLDGAMWHQLTHSTAAAASAAELVSVIRAFVF
jgi:hypothetical protein